MLICIFLITNDVKQLSVSLSFVYLLWWNFFSYLLSTLNSITWILEEFLLNFITYVCELSSDVHVETGAVSPSTGGVLGMEYHKHLYRLIILPAYCRILRVLLKNVLKIRLVRV